ncbi:HPr family phosphocarrier protein [Paenibacillus sediminis]|uniref:Phosphocarrier protein HPr n=1 Tax=Paenibacillus sediminis TaxID=664909 RepID=A0ABS4H1R4_9BACL|nr:HPr family phosphocarrier protein [Paenibacillus sediminis]MBP1936055.1 catabolite repression HPr-like protein/phosphocarrier protein [Paenibacillus sediminis]
MRVEKDIIVLRPDGLHARPAAELVKQMKQYESNIHIIYKDTKIDGKSIIQLMKLSVKQGEMLKVEIEGDDADEVAAAIERFLSSE